MFKFVESRFEYLKEIIIKNSLSTLKIQRAYNLAFDLHKEQIRKVATSANK
mgnify:CR=1 FL=1